MIREACEWMLTSQATNDLAVVVQGGVAGKTHFISHISAGYNGTVASPQPIVISDSTAGVLTTLSLASTAGAVIPAIISFDRPIKVTPGATLSVSLPAGGTGITGVVNVGGFSVVDSSSLSLVYLFRDKFYTPHGAPLGGSRTCEPGPGTLTITDSGNNLSIVAGQGLVCASGATTTAQTSTNYTRTRGRALVANVTPGLNSGFGWQEYAPYWGSSNQIVLADYGYMAIGSWVAATPVQVVVIQRVPVGMFIVVAGKMLWVDTTSSASPMYAVLSSFPGSYSAQDFRIIDIPSWSSEALVYTSKLVTPSASDTATMKKDALVDVSVTLPSAGTLQYAFRRTDDSNCLRLDVGPTGAGNCVLNKVVAGTPTALVTGTLTTRALVVLDGTSATLYCDNVNAGTGTDNLYSANTSIKVIGLGTGGAITTAYAWPRYPTIPTV